MKYGHFTLLPEQAFIKVGGQIKPQGGGTSSAPSSQTVTSTSIPEYAQPYAESMLGQTSALTNITNNPYQPYQGQQVAGFSPLQNQGFTSLGDMQVAPQIGQATDIANQASQGAMGTAAPAMGYGAAGAGLGAQGVGIGQQGMQAGMSYGQNATNPNAVAGYMNPYIQNTLAPALDIMNTQYGMQGAQEQGAATSAGAFGGSREALMQGLNQQNRMLAGNQLVGNAYNNAYNTANQNMQAASQLGMQGAGVGLQGINAGLQGVNTGLQGVSGAQNAYGLGIQGANTLGSLGTAQYNQQMGIAQAQLGAGAQQQQLAQQQLNVPYQQYQNQMNYPYTQLAFQSDMMRGLPLSQSAQNIYQNTGAMVPQLLGAGIAAYGATNKSAKEGGLMSYARGGAVQGYAMGGEPVVDPRAVAATNPAALSSKLAQLTDGQLQAYARTVKDAVALAEVKAEMARRAGVRQPQGEEPTQTVAQEVAGQGGIAEQPMMAAAGGGIVALAGGSEEPVKDKPGEIHDESSDAPTQTPNWTRFFPEGSLVRNLRLPVGSDVRNALNSQRQSADSAVQPNAISPEALAAANQAQQQQEMDSQVQTGMVPRAQLVDMNRVAQAQDADSQVQGGLDPYNIANTAARMTEDQQMQDADSQVQPRGGIAAIPPVARASAIAGAGAGAIPRTPAGATPAGGGITDVGTPAGGAPRTGGASIGNVSPDAIGKGAVPVGNPNDMSWGAFAANVKAASQLEPEDKALLADMQKRADRRLARAEGQEKNVLNEAIISGGIAMMGGMNLADGVRRAAEQGGKQYFSSQAEARKAINAAEDAQDAFNQYQMSYKQGNKKMIGEMYGKWQSSMLDFQGKIQAAGITAGASMANAKAQQEANAIRQTEVNRSHVENEQLRKDALEENAKLARERLAASETQARERLAATEYANNTQRQNAIRTYVQSDPAVVSLKEAGKNWANLPSSPEYKNNQALLQAAQRDALEEFHRIERQVAARGKTSTATGELPPLSSFQK